MSLIHSFNNEPFFRIRDCLNTAHNEIVVFSPYINVESIKELELNPALKCTIVTTLRLRDLLSRSSDIELYPYAKEKNIKIFIHNKIHLKVFMADWEKLVFGSSNLTKNGLGYSNNYNYELNGELDKLDSRTIYYFRKIIFESKLMDDEMYAYVKDMYDKEENIDENHEIELEQLETHTEKEFLISSLPMSKDIKLLHYLLNNNYIGGEPIDVNCAIHDQLLYDLPINLELEQFLGTLKERFFQSKFITRLLHYIDEEDRRFGSIKQWIQDNCADVPVPSRKDLTGNIQVLYSWIVELSEGQYVMDRPNHSQIIRRVW